jgi:hypothetical protein
MAGEIQLNSTTMATESSGTITLSNVNSATNRTNLGLGSIATQAADSVAISGGNITGGTIGSGVTFPAGHIIQVQHFTKTDAASTTNNQYLTWVHLGMVKSITTNNNTNKVLVNFTITLSSLTGGHNFVTKITRNHTGISETSIGVSTTGYSDALQATTGGTRLNDTNTYHNCTMNFLDSPNYDGEIEYKLYHMMQNITPGIGYLNRTQIGNNDNTHNGGISTITLYEIAQ